MGSIEYHLGPVQRTSTSEIQEWRDGEDSYTLVVSVEWPKHHRLVGSENSIEPAAFKGMLEMQKSGIGLEYHKLNFVNGSPVAYETKTRIMEARSGLSNARERNEAMALFVEQFQSIFRYKPEARQYLGTFFHEFMGRMDWDTPPKR